MPEETMPCEVLVDGGRARRIKYASNVRAESTIEKHKFKEPCTGGFWGIRFLEKPPSKTLSVIGKPGLNFPRNPVPIVASLASIQHLTCRGVRIPMSHTMHASSGTGGTFVASEELVGTVVLLTKLFNRGPQKLLPPNLKTTCAIATTAPGPSRTTKCS
ncbi:hypothetical protein C8F04DRAFT_1185684 [Mycena alexandri]|uniref:Uncharacterized protein n=1 Tax=Mycena alexandri TaxID=1745969 RepID=A0AAD6SPN3_9AGAR|nr:hypothetical protein C8F04DRAFT_1185684 [Mycena alexandri]